jgi:VanZ family protein
MFFPTLRETTTGGDRLSRFTSPTDDMLKKVDALLQELQQVRKLNERMDKIAMFLEDIRLADVVQNYTAPRKLIYINFLAGLARGLGLTIGTAIILVILGKLLGQFLSVPFIGDYIRALMDYISSFQTH